MSLIFSQTPVNRNVLQCAAFASNHLILICLILLALFIVIHCVSWLYSQSATYLLHRNEQWLFCQKLMRPQ